jgi:hypothetical protein
MTINFSLKHGYFLLSSEILEINSSKEKQKPSSSNQKQVVKGEEFF